MANISAGMVKELRDQTGAGMMDCKAALTENDGNLEAAVDWLRKKGLSKAAKKAGRVAAEGLIGIATTATKGIVVEVNSETDFVARNDLFQGLVKMIASAALDTGPDVDKILAAKAGSITIAEAIADTIAKIGENMTLRRAAELSVGKGVGRELCAQLGRRRPRPDRRDRRARIGRQCRRAQGLRPHGGDACRVRQSAGDRSVRSRSGDVEREKNVLAAKAAGQAGQRRREDRRVRASRLTTRRSACSSRPSFSTRRRSQRGAGHQRGRGEGRRADQGHGLRALCAGRRHRPPGGDFGGEVAALAGTH